MFDTEIFEAIEDGDIKAVKSRLDDGVDPNNVTHNGLHILVMAAYWDYKAATRTEIVQLLIDHGADVNGRDVLNKASFEGKTEVVKLLISKGAKVKTKKGITSPLHDAVVRDHVEIAELLIAEGADVNAQDSNRDTPLDRTDKDSKSAKLLRKHGGKTSRGLALIRRRARK